MKGSGAHILVIDDCEPLRFLKAQHLSDAGFNVVEASTGKEGLSSIALRQPDLLLLDVNLPDMHGSEVLREAKARWSLKVICTSAIEIPAELRRIADACVVSLEKNDLLSTIEAVLYDGSTSRNRSDGVRSNADGAQGERTLLPLSHPNPSVRAGRWTSEILDTLPTSLVVLGPDRKIDYCNRAAGSLAALSWASPAGMHLCHAFGCAHAQSEGELEPCRSCGSRTEIAAGEWHFPRLMPGTNELTYIRVTASPVRLKDGFVVCTLSDLTVERQWRVMERQFLHDALNLAGGVKGCAAMLKADGPQHVTPGLTDLLMQSATDLLSELIARRQLLRAAAGELDVNVGTHPTLELIRTAIAEYQQRSDYKDRRVVIESSSKNLLIETDREVVVGVLDSLLKNALMATPPGGFVVVGCQARADGVEFTVRDRGVIPEQIQSRVFQPPLSTGDAGKALRNYTVKLMTECYLRGQVRFESDPANGTCFFIYHPTSQERAGVGSQHETHFR